MSKRIVIVAAHPDDEALGCGATIAKHAANGDQVDIIFLADGETSRGEESSQATEKRREAALAAAAALGANTPVFLDFPDNQLDSLPLLRVVQALEEKMQPLSAEIVYTHHGGDLNIDHRVTHQAVLTACRPQPGGVDAIYTFEVLSSTGWNSPDCDPGFKPQHFVDVSRYFDKKLQALQQYESELREYPHARSLRAITALSEFRGSMVGLEKAEAFGVVRQIESSVN